MRAEALRSSQPLLSIPEVRWMMSSTKNSREPVIWNWCWTGSFLRKRIFPAIDIPKSGTRREDLLLTKEEQEAVDIMRRALNGMKSDEAVDSILNMFVPHEK